MEDYVVSIPQRDLGLMEELFSRMGWKVRPRRASIEQFIKSCPKTPVMTDESSHVTSVHSPFVDSMVSFPFMVLDLLPTRMLRIPLPSLRTRAVKDWAPASPKSTLRTLM